MPAEELECLHYVLRKKRIQSMIGMATAETRGARKGGVNDKNSA